MSSAPELPPSRMFWADHLAIGAAAAVLAQALGAYLFAVLGAALIPTSDGSGALLVFAAPLGNLVLFVPLWAWFRPRIPVFAKAWLWVHLITALAVSVVSYRLWFG